MRPTIALLIIYRLFCENVGFTFHLPTGIRVHLISALTNLIPAHGVGFRRDGGVENREISQGNNCQGKKVCRVPVPLKRHSPDTCSADKSCSSFGLPTRWR